MRFRSLRGSVAEACYGSVPEEIQRESLRRPDNSLRTEVLRFGGRYALLLVDDLEAEA